MTPDVLLTHATEFSFPVIPDGHYLNGRFRDAGSLRVNVTWRANRPGEDQDRWAVTKGGMCWACAPAARRTATSRKRQGHWEYEPTPSYRTDQFLRRARWTLAEAVDVVADALAHELAIIEGRHPA